MNSVELSKLEARVEILERKQVRMEKIISNDLVTKKEIIDNFNDLKNTTSIIKDNIDTLKNKESLFKNIYKYLSLILFVILLYNYFYIY